MNPYVIMAIISAFVLNGFYWNAHGSNAADTRWKAKIEQQRADAEVKAREQERLDRRLKDKADAENKRTTNRLRVDIARLRDANTNGGNLSSPTPATSGATGVCFDATKFDSALRILDKGVLGIVETCSQAVVDLDSAKLWATSVPDSIPATSSLTK